MERLKGKTILIGREPGPERRLLVAISGGKTAAIKRVVPGSVSRCRTADGTAHVKITVGQDGNMTIANMKARNLTYVNGAEIASKRITAADTVELGPERFDINLATVIETAKKIAAEGGAVQQEAFDISHLEEVWNRCHDSLKELRERQKKVNLIRSGCGIFTMCAMPCIFFLGPVGYALTGVGVLGNIYSFVGMKNDRSTDEQERIVEEFQDSYVCPHCGKFLGNTSYKRIKVQFKSPKDHKIHCPNGCGAEFIEK